MTQIVLVRIRPYSQNHQGCGCLVHRAPGSDKRRPRVPGCRLTAAVYVLAESVPTTLF